jgi:hypothetical protein
LICNDINLTSRSPGIDNIELLSSGGESVVKAYTRICNHVFKTGNWPNDWTTSIVVPLPKKGYLRKCNNYRTISLISHQARFNFRVLCEKYRQLGQPVYHNFVDYKKCFDRIWQEGIWAVLRKYNISPGIINSIEALYAASRSMVRVGEDFPTSLGVRQGCLLSPMMCNIFLENIMAESLVELESPLTISGRVINNL